jgi:hypothetical protein
MAETKVTEAYVVKGAKVEAFLVIPTAKKPQKACAIFPKGTKLNLVAKNGTWFKATYSTPTGVPTFAWLQKEK